MADSEFLTTREAAKRLGVSLGTVQHMVESGALEAWKTLGGHRRIPVAALEAHLGRRRTSIPSTIDTSGRLDLLIAEDDATLQKLYQLTIERWEMPINLRIVNNGFDGLVQVGQRVPDVLISDLMMPGMDGFEMIRRLRENAELAHMDILVVSAIDKDEVLAHEGFPSNITVFSKPIPFHEIKGFLLGRISARNRSST